MTQDESFTGGLCLVAFEPVSTYILLEHTAEARDQDPWHELMDSALAPFTCNVIQSTSDEAPGCWPTLHITLVSTTHPTSCMCNTS